MALLFLKCNNAAHDQKKKVYSFSTCICLIIILMVNVFSPIKLTTETSALRLSIITLKYLHMYVPIRTQTLQFERQKPSHSYACPCRSLLFDHFEIYYKQMLHEVILWAVHLSSWLSSLNVLLSAGQFVCTLLLCVCTLQHWDIVWCDQLVTGLFTKTKL